MSANANIRITATTEGVKTAFRDAVKAVNAFTTDFKAKATEVNTIAGKFGAIQDKIGRFSNQKSFQQGIIGDFNRLNDQLLVAEGRQALFGDAMATNRAKASAYTTTLNSLLAKGLQPNSEEAQNLAGKIKQLDGEFSRNQSATAFGAKMRGMAINGAFVLATSLLAVGGASLKAYAEMDGLSRGLQTVEGSAENAQKRIDGVLSSLAKMPGLGLQEVIKGDIALRNQGFSAGGSARIQAAFGNAIATSGGGKENFNQIIAQLGQMAAKGKVLAEDLKPIITQAPVVAKALRTLFGSVSSEDISKALQAKGQGSREFIQQLVTELEKAEKVTGGFKNELENADDALFQMGAEIGKTIDENTNLTQSLRYTNDMLVALKKPASNFTAGLLQGLMDATGFITKTMFPVMGLLGEYFGQAADEVAKANKVADFKGKGVSERTARLQLLKEENAELKKQLAYENQFAFSSNKSNIEKKLAENEATLKAYQKANMDARREARKGTGGAFDWGDFGGGSGNAPDVGKQVDEWIKQSNQRIEDGLREVKNNTMDRTMAELSKEISLSKVPAKLYIAPTETKLDKTLLASQIDKSLGSASVPITVTPTFVDNDNSTAAKIEDYLRGMGDAVSKKASAISDILSEALGNAFVSGFSNMGAAIGKGENPFKAFGEGILQSFGDTLMQIGAVMLKQAGLILTGAIMGGPAGLALGAEFYKSLAIGGALTVAGGAMKSVKLAKGGLANGPTMAMVGDNKGAGGFNPEVISPLNNLLGIISRAFSPVLKNFNGGGRQQYAMQPIEIHTYQYTDGRQTGRSVQRANYRGSKINP